MDLRERVTVESIAVDDPQLLFTATFNNAHDAEILGVQMPFPAWGSSQRHVFVGVTDDVTLDAEAPAHPRAHGATSPRAPRGLSVTLRMASTSVRGRSTMQCLAGSDFNPMAIISRSP